VIHDETNTAYAAKIVCKRKVRITKHLSVALLLTLPQCTLIVALVNTVASRSVSDLLGESHIPTN
jgi:hypothetical protein